RCKRKTKLFAERTLSGVKTWKGLLSLPIDLLVSPISILYFFFGRFFLAKSFVADYNCNSCGLCVKQCPVKAIVWKENRPFWTRKCESCMHCMNLCPKRAIQTPHAFVVLIWWLVLSLIPVTLVHIFSTPGDFISEHFSLFVWIFILLTAFPIVVFSYRILHFLMRYSFINRLVSFTSLTKFRFWRRYNASK
ncbi:MAG TPA: 4Fe-4S binding protein, partial [Draconibacterium sp.]|nr:4Fe-4S binding protein [Draconibacterium sp.]